MTRWAGLDLARPVVWGVLNVTPDSFSDGGAHADSEAAVRAGLAMREAGADVIDVGGESTRPGAAPVPASEEQARVLPVIEALADAGCVVSIDTRNAATMSAALRAGARIVNDVSGLTHDPLAAMTVAASRCPVVLMHMRGTPETMRARATYGDVASEVAAELADRIADALRAGIAPSAIAVDPGLGFAKTPPQSAALLGRLGQVAALGFPVLVGASRKRFVGILGGVLGGEAEPAARDGDSVVAGLFALARGAHMLRVHDVAATVRAVRVWHALALAGAAEGSEVGS